VETRITNLYTLPKTRGTLTTPLTRLASALAVALATILSAATASAGIYYDTSTGGDWGTSANWSPVGVPVAGDWINVDLAMTVNGDYSYGDSTGVNNSTGNSTITINDSYALTHVAGSLHSRRNTTINGPATGLGTYLNQGHYLETYRFYLNNNLLFDCPGTLEFRSNQFAQIAAGATVRVANGTLIKSGSDGFSIQNSGVITSVDGAGTLQPVKVDVQEGTLSIQNDGTGEFRFSSLTVAAGAILKLANSNMTYSSTTGDMFNVAGKIQITKALRVGEDVTFNAAQGVEWTDGSLYTNGHTVTNPSGSPNTITLGGETVYGDGTTGALVNEGTIRVTGRFYTSDGATYTNRGLHEFVSGDYSSVNAGTVFDNQGTLLKSGTDYYAIGQSGILRNSGTVQVTQAELELRSELDTTQFYNPTSKTLTSGTWRLLATEGAGTAILDLQDANSARVTTIGPGVTVELENSGASFPNLEAYLTTVNGTLLVNGTKNLDLAGASAGSLTVGATGLLGGTGTVTGNVSVSGTVAPGKQPGVLSVTGDLALLSDSTVEIEVLDPLGVAGTDWDLLSVSGQLALPAAGSVKLGLYALAPGLEAEGFSIPFASYGSVLNFSPSLFVIDDPLGSFVGGSLAVTQSGNQLWLNYTAIPEPASLTLLALLAVGLSNRAAVAGLRQRR